MAGFLARFLGLGFPIGHLPAVQIRTLAWTARERGSVAAPLHNRNLRPEGLKNPHAAAFFAGGRLRIVDVVKNSD